MLDKEKERDIGSIYSLKCPLYNEHTYSKKKPYWFVRT